jgi:hypothetical protein
LTSQPRRRGPSPRTIDSLLHPARKVRRVLSDARVRNLLLYQNLNTLAARHGGDGHPLTRSELKVFSQNGEDGVIAEILGRVGTTHRHFVEFGIGEGVEGNCVFLADVLGWNGLFIEGAESLYPALHHRYASVPGVTTLQALVTAENVESLLLGAGVPPDLDLLSIDIDGNDFWVWKAIETFTPRVLIIEYNGALSLDAALVQPYDTDAAWEATDYFGASLGAMERLGAEKGYFLAHTELSGTNAFFVREDLRERLGDVGTVARRTVNQSLQGATHIRDPKGGDYIDLGAR